LQDSIFHQWNLSPTTIAAITALGYKEPTPVQVAVIPKLLENQQNLLALAKTGTGKTAAFGIPLVEKLEKDAGLQALVLCPTRELAQQVAQSLVGLAAGNGLKVTTVLGGESYRKQIDSLRRNPEILVSTPGRLIDLMDQKIVKLAGAKFLIIDEADEMLSFGFQDALEQIWEELGDKGVYTWLFSATMSEPIRRLANKYLKNPITVTLNTTSEPTRVESFAAVVFEEDKEDAICLLIKNTPEFYGIIFAQTKKQVAELEQKFRSMGLAVESLHGDKVQADRTSVIGRMKSKATKILVATDVAARGLDIQDLTHVVNYEIPWDVETYTHRIGRTARAGKAGIVWTLVKPKEAHQLRKFERALKSDFKTLVIPSAIEAKKNQIKLWITKMGSMVLPESQLAAVTEAVRELEVDGEPVYTKKEIELIAKAVTLSKVGSDIGAKQPRAFELRRSDIEDRGFGGRERSGPPRGRGSFSDSRDGGRRPFRSAGGGGRSSFRGDSRSDDRSPDFSNEFAPRPQRDDRDQSFRPAAAARYPRPDSVTSASPRARFAKSDSFATPGLSGYGGNDRPARSYDRDQPPRERSFDRAPRTDSGSGGNKKVFKPKYIAGSKNKDRA
jgi:ATP-dependent RNA helicase DeaD